MLYFHERFIKQININPAKHLKWRFMFDRVPKTPLAGLDISRQQQLVIVQQKCYIYIYI